MFCSVEDFIHTYGYLAVLLGSCVEGESIVLTAGVLANKGYFSLIKVIAIAFSGTLVADQLCYYLGRHYGTAYLEKRPHWHKRVERIMSLLRQYDTLFILTFRFIYGIRIASPIVIGVARIEPKRFIILNFFSAAIWSVIVSCVGYLLAEAIQPVLDNFDEYQQYLFGGIFALAAIAAGIYYRYWRKKKNSRIDNKR